MLIVCTRDIIQLSWLVGNTKTSLRDWSINIFSKLITVYIAHNVQKIAIAHNVQKIAIVHNMQKIAHTVQKIAIANTTQKIAYNVQKIAIAHNMQERSPFCRKKLTICIK